MTLYPDDIGLPWTLTPPHIMVDLAHSRCFIEVGGIRFRRGPVPPVISCPWAKEGLFVSVVWLFHDAKPRSEIQRWSASSGKNNM